MQAEVHRFWKALASGSGEALQAMYFPNGLLFDANTRSSEPARLVLMRKLRKFAELKSSIRAEVGAIDVEAIGDIAIASYPYHFHLITTNPDGTVTALDVPFACATQIFQQDDQGVPRIFHEHFSIAEPGKKAQLPGGGAAAAHAAARASQAVEPSEQTATIAVPDWIPPSECIPAEQVRDAVHKFWQEFCGKSVDGLLEMYSPSASVIAAGARRSEPARLAMARRTRELFGHGSSVTADIRSIDVQAMGAQVSLASYSFRFHVIKMFANGKCFAIDMPFTRATQVFLRNEAGLLRIVHEHMSSAKTVTFKEMPAKELVF